MKRTSSITIWVARIFFIAIASTAFAQKVQETLDDVIQRHRKLAENYKTGITNCPLLRIDWYHGDTYYWHVENSGKAGDGSGGFYVYGRERVLNRTNLLAIEELINKFPLNIEKPSPRRDQYFISGLRSNQWFHVVYDRTNIPPEVEKVCKIIGW